MLPVVGKFGCAEKEDAKKHAISKGNSAIVIK
jgi:hypothetical protein